MLPRIKAGTKAYGGWGRGEDVQVLNLVKEVEVEPDSSSSSSFHIKEDGGFRTRKAVHGLGILYFYWGGGVRMYPRWNKSLFMPHPTPMDTNIFSKASEPSMFNIPDVFPCAGAVSPELGGYLVAPTVKLDVAEGKDIAAMLIAPHPDPTHLTLGKNSLSIPADGSDARIELTSNGHLNCEGTFSTGSNSARLVLKRDSNPPIRDFGLVEELVQAKEPGPINASWKPVTRSFEELLFVYRPLDVDLGDLDRLVEHVGASTDTFDEAGATPFIIGDSSAGSYTVRLVLSRHHRGDLEDETQISVT
jgi:hypothetical protein